MAFTQYKLDRSVLQARGIFNKYIYETDDTIAEVTSPGYFIESRFIQIDNDETNGMGWSGGILECSCSDGYIVGQISADGLSLTNALPSGSEIIGDLSPYQVPMKDATDTKLVYAGATVDPTTGEWTFDKTINVPAGSVNVGSATTLSEGGEDLLILGNITDKRGFALTANFDETGTTAPSYIDLGAQFSNVLQGVDTDSTTDNPIEFTITGGVVAPNIRQTNQVTFRASAPMPNVSARITDVVSGTVIRYVPNKQEWDYGSDGLNFIAGDNVVDFISKDPSSAGVFNIGTVPFRLSAGQQINVEIKADSMSLLGVQAGPSFFPYLTQLIQEGQKVFILNESDRVSVDGIQSPNIKTGAGLESLDNGDGTVTIKTSGQVDVIELDVDVDSTVTLDKAFVGKLCLIVQKVSVTPIPMIITISDHGEFETGDTISIGTDASYKNYFYAVYYNDSQGANLVAYPSRLQGVRLVRTLESWDVSIDGNYSKVAVRPKAKAGIPFADNDPDVRPVQAFSFIDNPAVGYIEDDAGNRAIEIDLNKVESYSGQGLGVPEPISVGNTDLILTEPVGYYVSQSNSPSLLTIKVNDSDGYSEFRVIYDNANNVTRSVKISADGITDDTKSIEKGEVWECRVTLDRSAVSGNTFFWTRIDDGTSTFITQEETALLIEENNDEIITPNQGAQFQLIDADKSSGYGDNGSITYYGPNYSTGQAGALINKLANSKSYFVHKETSSKHGFAMLHESYVSQIYNQDVTGVSELTMLFGPKSRGRYAKNNQVTPAGMVLNWNGEYLPDTEDPNDLNPSSWIDLAGNATQDWSDTGIKTACYSVGLMANNGSALLQRGDVFCHDNAGVKTSTFTADSDSEFFVIPIKVGGGTLSDLKLFPLFMSRLYETQNEWESYTFDNSADCVGAILKIAYDAAIEKEDEAIKNEEEQLLAGLAGGRLYINKLKVGKL